MKQIRRVLFTAVSASALMLLGMPSAFAQAPIITAFAPVFGPVGAVVTIAGTNFIGTNSVTFNGTLASFTVNSSTQMRATVPSGATTGPISVTTPSGTATTLAVFTVTAGPSVVDCTASTSALQPAIDAALPGETLDVSGTCVGTFTVSKNLTLEGAGATLDGGGGGTTLTVYSGEVKVIGLTITGGNAIVGGGLFNYGALTIVGSKVIGNVASFNAGGIFNAGKLVLTTSTVSGNSARNSKLGAGGIFNGNTASLTITGSTVTENSSAYGAGVQNFGALNIEGSKVTRNSASSNGGGIFNGTSGSVTVTDSKVKGNSASFGGGGIFNGGGNLTIKNTAVSGNSLASGVGGGVFNFLGTVTIRESTVSGNSLVSGSGGGVFNSGGSLDVAGSTVSGNTASFDGGGIYNRGSLTIVTSTVSVNSASDGGGGIFNDFRDASTLMLTNSTVSGNSAPYGGGIMNIGTLTVLRSTVSANVAPVAGGGLFNGTAAQVTGSTTLGASIDAGNVGGDCGGTVTSVGYNLVGPHCGFSALTDLIVGDTAQAIGIGPLDVNGVGTETMALVRRSRAVDAIPVGALAVGGALLCPPSGTEDQRGIARPQGVACDIGAYELKL